MPTSLTYIILAPEALHLGDLMRIWVRPATKIIMPPSDFQGPTRAFRTPQEGWCFTEVIPLSPDNPIPGVVTILTKKRKLFPELLPTSPSSFALPRLMTPECMRHLHKAAAHNQVPPISVGRVGNINPIPFRSEGLPAHTHTHTHARGKRSQQGTPRLCTESPDRLGPPDPWPTAVRMEPFSTSAFKALT